MGAEDSNIQRMALDLLAATHQNREAEVMAAFRADITADNAMLLTYGAARLLENETTVLSDRMLTLANKQRKFNGPVGRLVGSMTGLAQYPSIQRIDEYTWGDRDTMYRTPPLFATNAEMIGNVPMCTGWVFETTPPDSDYENTRYVTIYEAVTNIDSGESHLEALFSITAHDPSFAGKVRVRGAGFAEYAQVSREKFQATHPTLYKIYMRPIEDLMRRGQASIDIEDDPRQQTSMLDQLLNPSPTFDVMLTRDQRLDLEMKLGEDDWDYPEGLYLRPLGLIMQANKALGTKRRKVVK